MAFASIGTLGATANKTAATSITHTTATTSLAVGNVCVVVVAKDPAANAAGTQTNEITSVTDSAGNTYTKAYEWSGGTGANAGVVVAVYFSVLTAALNTGGTITANFSDSRTAKIISAWGYSVASGATVAVDGATGANGTNGSQFSITSSSLTNVEHLAVRFSAVEAATAFTLVQSGWTALNSANTTGGGGATNITGSGLFKVEAASTSVTSAPTSGGIAGPYAAALVAFREVAGGPQTYNDTRSEPATSGHGQTSVATFPNAHSETATAGDSFTGGILHTATLAESASAAHDQSGTVTAGNQFLRPDGQISTGSWTNDWAALDEAVADDADLAYSQDNPNGSIFEVSLSDPGGTPGAGTTTVRYRHAQVLSGVVDGTGTATALNVSVVQGTTILASDAEQAPGGSWVTREWTPDLSGVTDWTDLRLRFTATGGGGSPANRRGVGVSWAEIEVPAGGAATYNVSRAEPATAADGADSAATFPAAQSEAATAGDSVSGGLLSAGATTESATAGDSVTVAVIRNPALAESATAGESAASAATWPNTRSESAAANDNTAGANTLAVTRTETATAADTAAGNVTTGAQTYNETLSETGTAGDSRAVAATFATSAAESASAGDAATTAQTFVSALGEALAANDAATAAAIVLAALAEAGTAADSATGNVTAGAQTYNESVSEGATGNAAQASVAQYAANRAEAAGAAETFAAGLVAGLALAEAAASAASHNGGLIFARTVNEAAAANDNAAAVVDWGASLAETENVVDLWEASGGTPPRVPTVSRPAPEPAARPVAVEHSRPPQAIAERPARSGSARPRTLSSGRR